MMEQTTVTVSKLNDYLKTVLESDFNLQNIWVCGEISNLTIHGSGHIYFSLKDEGGLIRAVMFRSGAAKLRFRPEEGMKVLAHGSVSVYGKSGSYQLYVTALQENGAGDLYTAFEQLKKELAAAGIFDQSHKKPIPPYPRRIGVITSPTGAAVRDMIDITGRRYPPAELLIYPAIVQGDQAPASLIAGLEYFERTRAVDVIIIGRGGGSIEDLWGFNSADLALAIYNCTIPIISAVGHETDFTICDFAADLRAPTPSGAAELAVPNLPDLLSHIRQQNGRIAASMHARLNAARERLARYRESGVLRDPKQFTNIPFMELDGLKTRMCARMNMICSGRRAALDLQISTLDALSPLKILRRGYAVALNDQRKAVTSVRTLKRGDALSIRFSDGAAQCCVNELTEETDETGTEL